MMEEKVEALIEALEDSTLMKEYLLAKDKVKSDQKLCQKIALFHENQDWSLRKEIMENQDYLTYQENENELYYLTLEINRRLKELVGGTKNHESH